MLKVIYLVAASWHVVNSGKTLINKYIDLRVQVLFGVCCFMLHQRNPLRRIT